MGNAFDDVALIKYGKNLYCYSCNLMQCVRMCAELTYDEKHEERTLTLKDQQSLVVQFVLLIILKPHKVDYTFFVQVV